MSSLIESPSAAFLGKVSSFRNRIELKDALNNRIPGDFNVARFEFSFGELYSFYNTSNGITEN